MTRLSEGRLLFDFSAAVRAERLDERGRPTPVGMSLVDFVVEERGRVLLIEVKDPKGAAPDHREDAIARFVKELRRDRLVNEAFVPKARDSYTYLHLMERDDKAFTFVVLLGVPTDEALLLGFKERLLARLRKEADEPWKRHYVADCVAVTVDRWSTAFPHFPLTVTDDG